MDFLSQNRIKTDPFFMILAPPAPHAPFTPSPRHSQSFPNEKVRRTPSFNYTSKNVSNNNYSKQLHAIKIILSTRNIGW